MRRLFCKTVSRPVGAGPRLMPTVGGARWSGGIRNHEKAMRSKSIGSIPPWH